MFSIFCNNLEGIVSLTFAKKKREVLDSVNPYLYFYLVANLLVITHQSFLFLTGTC